MKESSDPRARQRTADTRAPSHAHVERRVRVLVVGLGGALTLPYLAGLGRAWLAGEAGLGWLAGVAGGLVALAVALSAARRAIAPELRALETAHAELDARCRSASATARDTNDYLRDVSHEIRASMHAVLGLAQLLSRSPLDATQHRQIRTIDGAARALLRIINDLLALSDPEPRGFDLLPMGCSLHELLGVSADLLEPSAKDKGLVLELHLSPSLPDRVLIDAGRVQLVVLGVCRHAIETCEQGPLRIEAHPERLADKRFELVLTVEGPPTAHASSPRAASDVSPGSAAAPASQAGLSLSRRLAALMGGSVQLGEPKCKIRLLLPMPRADGMPDVPARAQRLPPPPPIRLPAVSSPILLVEADERVQASAVELIENLGFDVEVAGSGARALERVSESKFALILMATRLADVDAYSAAASLRRRVGSRPAIVGCTGESVASAQARAGAASFDAFLPTPLERAALCSALAEWLPDEIHPASSGTRLSQSGALKQATRRAFAAMKTSPGRMEPDVAPGLRRERLLELLLIDAPVQVRALRLAATSERRDEVAKLARGLAERCASAGAAKMAALCRSLSGAADLSREQLGDLAEALVQALIALRVALGEVAPLSSQSLPPESVPLSQSDPPSDPALESAPAAASSDRSPDSP
jgi:CheY-like chemotaxis protein/HPt (histidine-containing phosphotransfer) domain-containing protein